MYKSARTSSVCSAMEYSCNSGIVNNSDHVIWRGWDYYVEWVKYLSIIMKCVSLMHICENNYFVGNRHISQLAYIFIRHFSLIIHHVSAQSFVNWTLKIWSSPSNLILATVLQEITLVFLISDTWLFRHLIERCCFNVISLTKNSLSLIKRNDKQW